jgi:8-oxo-dGTP diphosphatase
LNPEVPDSAVHVVAAAVINRMGRVLIAQRLPGKHLAGGWEFPGGKLEPGEERRAGLARELREEIGIAIANPRPLMRLRHAYPNGEVLLDIWVVRHYRGEPSGLDGQALRWCTQTELQAADLLPADRPILAALRLPQKLRQVSSPGYTIGELPELSQQGRLRGVFCASTPQALAAAKAGADFLVLRGQFACSEIAAICHGVSIPVYAPGVGLEEAWTLGASGTNEIRPR